jgi:hypothetical protein
MRIATSSGYCDVGGAVLLNVNGRQKIGKLLFVDPVSFLCDVYVSDSTGGYTMRFNATELEPYLSEDTLSEQIKKPERYNKRGKLECWDVILDQEMNFLEGSVLKYLWRYKEKNGIHDLEKAKVYIDKLISEVEKK